MLFSSIPFLFFFLPLTLAVYYYCPALKGRNYILLAASLLFYAWGEPVYVVIMIVSICFNYRMGLCAADETLSLSVRKIVLAAAIAGNLLVLFYFKYLGFALSVVRPLFTAFHAEAPAARDIVMPIGISFYTFQSISYLADGFKKPCLAQRNLLDLGLYITFFPQLIAGPIVRYHDINGQIAGRAHSVPLFAQGAQRFIIGLSKKTLLANTFAKVADGILAAPLQMLPTRYAWIALLAYTLQIYYDFSGYSDMAIGLGKMFGFNLPENFNYPYMSASLTEFWRRWHITLSAWFKDYLYIPLGGNRKGKARTAVNLFTVFLVTGLWHGASFGFMLWGLGHGTLLFIEKIAGGKINAAFKDGGRTTGGCLASLVKTILSHGYALSAVILLWALFRLDIKDSLAFFPALFSFRAGNSTAETAALPLLLDTKFWLFFAAGVAGAFPWRLRVEALCTRRRFFQFAPVVKYGVSLCLLMLSVCALAGNAYNPFIYFRF